MWQFEFFLSSLAKKKKTTRFLYGVLSEFVLRKKHNEQLHNLDQNDFEP